MKVNVVKKAIKGKITIGVKAKENIIMTVFWVWLIISALGMVLANDFLSCVRIAVASVVSGASLVVILKNFLGEYYEKNTGYFIQEKEKRGYKGNKNNRKRKRKMDKN